MTDNAKAAWNDVGGHFASLGRRVADRYKQGGAEGSVEETGRKLEQAAQGVVEELTRGFNAIDGTLRDDAAKKELKDAVNAIGSAITATVTETSETIRSRTGPDETTD